MAQTLDISQQSRTQIDWEGVARLVGQELGIDSNAQLQIKQFSEGYSNLTYLIRIGDWEAVLRRPPFGEIPPRAHDMEREYGLLTKIHPVFPLAPEPYLYSEGKGIMDKHFYIMEKKDGVVLNDRFPESIPETDEVKRKVSEAVVDTLVGLHSVDIKETGIVSIGKPDGFLERQVHGWIKRYHRSKTDDIKGTDVVEKWLADNIPTSLAPTIVHNDFKLNNMMFKSGKPDTVVGILDWELSTVGDPLTDLGAAVAYWAQPDDPDTGLESLTNNSFGFYTREQFIQRYAEKSGRDVSDINYYLTFAFYKIAVILQQIYARWKSGEIKDDRFARLGVGIGNLMGEAYRRV